MRFILVMLFCSISVNAMGMTYVEHIERYYKPLVLKIQEYGLAGPIAMELAQFALLRQIYEDGPQRPADKSMNGMVPGGINKRVMERLDWTRNDLSRVGSKDGQGCYCIKGPDANIQGAAAIALWYDEIIDTWPSIKDEERELWRRSKANSYLQTTAFIDTDYVMGFLGDEPARLALLRKANSWYGPSGGQLDRMRRDLRPVFIRAMNASSNEDGRSSHGAMD